jgi:hypothetical protein
MTVADPSAQHDVPHRREGGDLRYRSFGTNAQRIPLRLPQRMTPSDREHPHPSVHGVGRHNAKHIPAAPDGTQHVADRALISTENPHSTARLRNG